MFVGGLLTKGIKAAYKAYKTAGGKKIADLAKSQPGLKSSKRKFAKEDIKSELRRSKFTTQQDKNKLK